MKPTFSNNSYVFLLYGTRKEGIACALLSSPWYIVYWLKHKKPLGDRELVSPSPTLTSTAYKWYNGNKKEERKCQQQYSYPLLPFIYVRQDFRSIRLLKPNTKTVLMYNLTFLSICHKLNQTLPKFPKISRHKNLISFSNLFFTFKAVFCSRVER